MRLETGLNIRLAEAKKQIGDLEGKVMENNKAEQKRERRIMQHKNTLTELSVSIKHNDIPTIGDPEEEERENGQKFISRNNSRGKRVKMAG